jgi:AraC family L-rhamnose operon transcriptional activator RhaR
VIAVAWCWKIDLTRGTSTEPRHGETASAMLLHTDQPVTQIGLTVGWPDQNYFARRFKAHYGLAASTDRARFSPTAVHLNSADH